MIAGQWQKNGGGSLEGVGGENFSSFQMMLHPVSLTHTLSLQPMLTDTHTGMHVHSLSLSLTHTHTRTGKQVRSHTHARTHSVASDPFIFPSFSNEPAFKMTDFKDEVF